MPKIILTEENQLQNIQYNQKRRLHLSKFIFISLVCVFFIWLFDLFIGNYFYIKMEGIVIPVISQEFDILQKNDFLIEEIYRYNGEYIKSGMKIAKLKLIGKDLEEFETLKNNILTSKVQISKQNILIAEIEKSLKKFNRNNGNFVSDITYIQTLNLFTSAVTKLNEFENILHTNQIIFDKKFNNIDNNGITYLETIHDGLLRIDENLYLNGASIKKTDLDKPKIISKESIILAYFSPNIDLNRIQLGSKAIAIVNYDIIVNCKVIAISNFANRIRQEFKNINLPENNYIEIKLEMNDNNIPIGTKLIVRM